MMNNAPMPYIDTSILESDAPGMTGDDFDIVALVTADGRPCQLVKSSYGLSTDMSSLPAARAVTRLLVAVTDPHDAAAADRVRRALRWDGRAPF